MNREKAGFNDFTTLNELHMNSKELFARACKVIPGGVNSPVRAFNSVGGDPVYIVKGNGSRMQTADGVELIDFCGSWGPLPLGHARPEVVEAIKQAASDGTSFGTNTPREVEFAELICELVPYIDMVRLVSSGTEAVMTALRLARGYTGRNKILKFEGGYHGHTDCLLVSAGSGLLTAGISSSAGVPDSMTADIFVAPYNDIDAVRQIVSENANDLAAIIMEPVAGNMGLVPSKPGFLEELRQISDDCGALLIFDEVINGFRLGPTTYGNMCDVTPDLTTLGKIIGGGMPIGALGGRKDIMESLAPLGAVYQAGTLSGNPVAVAAGMTTLKILRDENPYPEMARLGKKLADSVNSHCAEKNIDMHIAQLGGVFTPFFRKEEIKNLEDAKCCDTKQHAKFFHSMLKSGIYLPPSQFEAAFVSAAHTEEDINIFVEKTLLALQ